jgi:hypothetical protein
MPLPKIYAQTSGSSSSEENVCTAEELTANVCTPKDGLSTEENVCTAEEQTENVCVPDLTDVSCEGDLRQEYFSAETALEEMNKITSGYLVTYGSINGRINTVPNSNLYWFPTLYAYTTLYEIESIQRHEHKHPAMVAHFIPIFFGLYKQALDNYQKKDYSKVPPYWMNHFKMSENKKISSWNAKSSLESAVVAHIRFDMPQALVIAYKSFTNKYCPANPPPLDYFRSDFFSPAALKIFARSQAGMYTEIYRVLQPNAPFTPSIEKGQLILGIGSESEFVPGLKMKHVLQGREDAWEQAKKELGQ